MMELCVDFSAVRGRHLLVALSGGADSVALLTLLVRAQEACDLTLSAAHLDHGIRPESADDAAFCRELCRGLGVPFHTARVDVPAAARACGEGLESAARRLRYRWLREIEAEVGADCIALAHHMDDQAETVLMHLLRGAGPEGTAGMGVMSGDLYRPLLGVRRAALREYLAQQGQGWREDATNALADNPRNSLRLHGIPALEQSYPCAVSAIARFAEAQATEGDFLEKQTEVYIQEEVVPLPEGTCFGLSSRPHPAILRRALRKRGPIPLDHDHLAAAAKLAESSRGKLSLPGGWLAERGWNGLYLIQNRPKSEIEAQLSLSEPTKVGRLATLTPAPCAPVPVRDDPFRQALDPAALEGAVVRTRRDGDRFRPLGCGDRLLSDYLIDRGVDRPLRDHIALVAKGSRVLWVCGLGISEDVKLKPGAAEAVSLSCDYAFDMRRLLKYDKGQK